jgi:hypothetical protein
LFVPFLSRVLFFLFSSLNLVVSLQKEKIKNAKRAKRDAFMVCTIYSAVNLALIDYKQKICGSENNTNYEKSFKF